MTDAPPADTRRVPLSCPRCGGDLDGLPADRVFGCRPCALACSVGPAGLAPDPLVVWRPEAPGTHLYLPLWVLGVDEAVAELPRPSRTSLPAGAPPAEDRRIPFRGRRVFVTAFDLRGRVRFGDPGMHLTRRQPEPATAEDAAPPLAGAVLTRAVAEEVAPTAILSVIDVQADVLGARLELRIRGAYLALVPFRLQDDGWLREPFGGVAYPPAAIADLDALRRLQGA